VGGKSPALGQHFITPILLLWSPAWWPVCFAILGPSPGCRWGLITAARDWACIAWHATRLWIPRPWAAFVACSFLTARQMPVHRGPPGATSTDLFANSPLAFFAL